MRLIGPILFLLLILLPAGLARADKVHLRNGRTIEGKIVKEEKREVTIDLGGGMLMKIRRSTIESIEKIAEAPTEPEPAAEEPKPTPDTVPKAEPLPVKKRKPTPAFWESARWFSRPPGETWRSKMGRYPDLTVSKLTRFRAYDLIERAPLRLDAGDPKLAMLAARYGHGGVLSQWKFKFVGTLELRYGDKLKFLGEILNPPGLVPPLVELKEGPVVSAPRLVVFLLERRRGGFERYATTTVFQGRDFRTETLRALEKERLPVRTFDTSFGRVTTTWMTPSESKFLDNLNSPFGESPRTRIARLRFRLEWFRAPKENRLPLDPLLLKDNAVRPVAAEGRPVASDGLVKQMWGSEELTLKRLGDELRKVTASLAKVGIRSGKSYVIERDKIGTFSVAGVTITTQRLELTKEVIKDLTRLRD